MKSILRVERDSTKKEIPDFKVGDNIRVHVKVVEGEKVRTQVFQGAVIGRRGGGVRETITVRKISGNVAVERVFPIHSPNVILIERVTEGRVRRAQLTYMRGRKGKRARISGRRTEGALASAAEVLAAATEGAEEETEGKRKPKVAPKVKASKKK
jgi:large subunit ribosomal protein L19